MSTASKSTFVICGKPVTTAEDFENACKAIDQELRVQRIAAAARRIQKGRNLLVGKRIVLDPILPQPDPDNLPWKDEPR
jgi:hypothetical protein